MFIDLNELSRTIHENALNKGFYPDSQNPSFNNLVIPHRIMMVITELSEAVEADTKGKYFDGPHLRPFPADPNISSLDDQMRSYTLEDWISKFEERIKDTFEDEMADAIIRILDLCALLGIDIETHIRMKMRYNSTRPHKHGKKY